LCPFIRPPSTEKEEKEEEEEKTSFPAFIFSLIWFVSLSLFDTIFVWLP